LMCSCTDPSWIRAGLAGSAEEKTQGSAHFVHPFGAGVLAVVLDRVEACHLAPRENLRAAHP
jgi:hypothetical protein